MIYWKNVRDKFLGFTAEELKLPVIIGGGEWLDDFHGFESEMFGKKVYDKAITGADVLEMLQKLSLEELDAVVDEDFEYTDGKFGVGLNRVYLENTVWFSTDEGKLDDVCYYPLQDSVDGTRIPSDTAAKRQFISDRRFFREESKENDTPLATKTKLIAPGTVIVIETTDGACLLDEKDYLEGA